MPVNIGGRATDAGVSQPPIVPAVTGTVATNDAASMIKAPGKYVVLDEHDINIFDLPSMLIISFQEKLLQNPYIFRFGYYMLGSTEDELLNRYFARGSSDNELGSIMR